MFNANCLLSLEKLYTMNPFIIRGYLGNKYFCDREKETEIFIHAIQNGRDITLVSLRKMGKTGLLLHAFERLKKQKGIETIYLDIYHTENLNGFINQLATALFRMKKSFGERMKEFLINFRFVRPVISLDPLSGLPTVTFQIADEKEARNTMNELFAILKERSKNTLVVIGIDEFQQISNYPEPNVEALIRGMIQTLRNVRFIFSGSNKTILARMFGDATRPFYQSTEMMFLTEIDATTYQHFIKALFTKNLREADDGIITEILDWCRCHTWYVQYLSNKLFERGQNLNQENLKKTQQEILASLEPFYLEYRNLLTRHQWQLLKAIAHTKGSNMLTSGSFVRKYKLTNASTIKRGVDSLLDKEMIYKKDDNYFVYDVFFSRWLETQDI